MANNYGILVTPGIPALEYARRRTALAQKLPANSIAVIAAARIKYKSGAVFYPFHQDANFFYLTGQPSGSSFWRRKGNADLGLRV